MFYTGLVEALYSPIGRVGASIGLVSSLIFSPMNISADNGLVAAATAPTRTSPVTNTQKIIVPSSSPREVSEPVARPTVPAEPKHHTPLPPTLPPSSVHFPAPSPYPQPQDLGLFLLSPGYFGVTSGFLDEAERQEKYNDLSGFGTYNGVKLDGPALLSGFTLAIDGLDRLLGDNPDYARFRDVHPRLDGLFSAVVYPLSDFTASTVERFADVAAIQHALSDFHLGGSLFDNFNITGKIDNYRRGRPLVPSSYDYGDNSLSQSVASIFRKFHTGKMRFTFNPDITRLSPYVTSLTLAELGEHSKGPYIFIFELFKSFDERGPFSDFDRAGNSALTPLPLFNQN